MPLEEHPFQGDTFYKNRTTGCDPLPNLTLVSPQGIHQGHQSNYPLLAKVGFQYNRPSSVLTENQKVGHPSCTALSKKEDALHDLHVHRKPCRIKLIETGGWIIYL